MEIKNRSKLLCVILICPDLAEDQFYKKFLIISGSIEEDYIAEYLVSGKIDFLQKPFLIEKLLTSLKQLLYPQKKTAHSISYGIIFHD